MGGGNAQTIILYPYAVDSNGNLTPAAAVTVTTVGNRLIAYNSDPRQWMALDPQGAFLYTADADSPGHLYAYAIGPGASLSLKDTQVAGDGPLLVSTDSNANIYVANVYGTPSIQLFALNRTTSALNLVSTYGALGTSSEWDAGADPLGPGQGSSVYGQLAFDPTGAFFVAPTGPCGYLIQLYSHAATGALTPLAGSPAFGAFFQGQWVFMQ